MDKLGIWMNSQDLLRYGPDYVFSKISDYGFNAASLFVGAGNVIFVPNKTLYGVMAPVHDPNLKGRDLLKEACKSAAEHGVKLTATVICFPDEYHAQRFPQYTAQDASGERHQGFLCPNRNEAREYLKNLVNDVCSGYDIEAIELDYVRYKRNREDRELPILLFAGKYCYCDACRTKAEASGLDWQEVMSSAKEVLQKAREVNSGTFRNTAELHRNAFDLVRFYINYPVLTRWLKFRTDTITSFVTEVKSVVKSTNKKIELSADLFYPTLSWIVGQSYEQLGKPLDSAKPMIYSGALGGWETQCLRSLHKRLADLGEEDLIQFLNDTQGFKSRASNFAGLEVDGACDEYVFYEARKARLLLGDETKLHVGLSSGWVPGVRFSTPVRVKYDVENALKAGSDGLWFFSYGATSDEILQTIRNSISSLK